MTFDIEIVLRERNYAVTERVTHPTEPAEWTEPDVEQVLKSILLAIDRVPGLAERAAHARQHLRDRLNEHQGYIEQHGEDMPEVRNWKWPYNAQVIGV